MIYRAASGPGSTSAPNPPPRPNPAFHTRPSTSPSVPPAVRAFLSQTRAVLRPRSKMFGSKPSQAPVVKGAPRKTKRI